MVKKRCLLSGVGGFIGSHVLNHFLEFTDWEIVGIAAWTHKGIPERILESERYQENKDRVDIITHDLNAPFSKMTKERIGHVDYIINLAAESHVTRSIMDPVSFIKNNVNVALNMLEFAREVKPEMFIAFSTDEVYGPAPKGIDHVEWSPIIPSNPYSGSKACQEAISISYWRTYGVPVIITNTMNNFGEKQDPEKYIPMCIKKILAGETVTIHSYPDKKTAGSRFYIHARNSADALLFILNNLPSHRFPETDRPDRYNIVGELELDNLSLAKIIAEILGKELKYELTDSHSERPGHDCRYGLSSEKLKSLGYQYPKNFRDSLKKTIEWTLSHPKWLC